MDCSCFVEGGRQKLNTAKFPLCKALCGAGPGLSVCSHSIAPSLSPELPSCMAGQNRAYAKANSLEIAQDAGCRSRETATKILVGRFYWLLCRQEPYQIGQLTCTLQSSPSDCSQFRCMCPRSRWRITQLAKFSTGYVAESQPAASLQR